MPPPPQSVLTQQHARDFMENGFLRLPGAVSRDLVRAARRMINTTIGEEGIDQEKIPTFQSTTWCPSIRSHAAITDLLNASSLLPTLREIFGGDVFPLAAGGQIALRFPLPAEEAAAAAARPLPLRWGGHLDGLHTPLNGVPKGGPH